MITTATMTDDAARTTIRSILDDLRDDAARADVLRRALLLYRVALDARERGDRLAVVGMDGEIVWEYEGLGGGLSRADVVNMTTGGIR